MSDISWIKIKTNLFNDEKIQLIEAMPEADLILVIWLKLLIQAGKTNNNGFIYLSQNIPYSLEMLSTIFRRSLDSLKFALKVLTDFGMIEVMERNVICISNWDKHQNIEGLDKVREQNKIRQAKYRNKKLSIESENKESITLCNVTVTEQSKNKIKKKELDIYKESSFNQFWDVYDKKKDADKCKNKFKTLTKDEIDLILIHLPEYVKSTPDKQFRKNPLTYLNNKCWNDEIIKSEGTNGNINANFKFRKQTNDKRFPVIS